MWVIYYLFERMDKDVEDDEELINSLEKYMRHQRLVRHNTRESLNGACPTVRASLPLK